MSYVTDKLADTTFDCHPKAWAVLFFLAATHPEAIGARWAKEDVEVNSWPWYNGRERGFCVSLRPVRGASACAEPVLYVTFGEHRRSDSFFIDHWTGRYTLNPPTVRDWPEEAYKNRLDADSVEEAVQKILGLMSAHYKMVTSNA